MSVNRRMIEALWPEGSGWVPEVDAGMDQFLNGKANNLDAIYTFLAALADTRNPEKTIILKDLEREYGLSDNSLVLSEATRRARLSGQVFQGKTTGSKDDLQAALDQSGFDLLVHENSPAVDPDLFLVGSFSATCGTATSVCGNQDAFCSFSSGELVVTGDVVNQQPAYLSACGVLEAVCGNTLANCGYFEGYDQTTIQYDTPPSTGWPLIFFVGGAATRDGTGALTQIDFGSVPLTRKSELKSLIIKIKPLHSWCALLVEYT